MTGLPPPVVPTAGRVDNAAALLFDGPQQAGSALDAAAFPMSSGGGRKISEVARKVARREIRQALIEVLDIKLANVVLRAWQRHGALLAAAQRTTNGGREVVLLADHTVTSRHSPHVDLIIDGMDIARISAAIVLTLRITGVNAIVERGALSGLEGGAIDAAAKFSVEDVPIASRSQMIDVPGVIRLDRPIALAAPARSADETDTL